MFHIKICGVRLASDVQCASEGGADAVGLNFFEPSDPVIEPFTRDACTAVRTNSTRHRVQWEGAEDLSHLVGRPVRFRFYLRGGRLYSFWVSPDESGASYGYVAAGGPGLTGPRDTVGGEANEE